MSQLLLPSSPARSTLPATLAGLLVLGAALPAAASQRHFTHTYESLVLAPGQVELEPSTTFRGGRAKLYLRFDERLELEVGVLQNLQSAWYLNASAVTEAHGEALARTFEFEGVSNEWKWKLLDPVADPLGLALYGEWSAGPSEAELEAKLILDKRFGDLLAAANLVGAVEWELEEADEVETEYELELDLGLAWLLTSSFSLGLELVDQTLFTGEGLEHSVVSAGPSLSYQQERWWVALSVLPQIVDLSALGGTGLQDLDEHERVSARVLFGVHL